MPPFLVVDSERLMRESPAAQKATEDLKEAIQAKRAKHAQLKEQAKSATGMAQTALMDQVRVFEDEALSALESEREQLRDAVLARLDPLLRVLCKERGVEAVLEAGAVVACPKDWDVTDDVMARMSEAS